MARAWRPEVWSWQALIQSRRQSLSNLDQQHTLLSHYSGIVAADSECNGLPNSQNSIKPYGHRDHKFWAAIVVSKARRAKCLRGEEITLVSWDSGIGFGLDKLVMLNVVAHVSISLEDGMTHGVCCRGGNVRKIRYRNADPASSTRDRYKVPKGPMLIVILHG